MGREMQIQNYIKTCYRKGNRRILRKSLCGPPNRIDPLVNKVGVQRYQIDPLSLSLEIEAKLTHTKI